MRKPALISLIVPVLLAAACKLERHELRSEGSTTADEGFVVDGLGIEGELGTVCAAYSQAALLARIDTLADSVGTAAHLRAERICQAAIATSL